MLRGMSLRNSTGWVTGLAGAVVVAWFWLGDVVPHLWVIAVIAAAIGGALWAWRALVAHRHSRELREFALQYGWDYARHAVGYATRFSGYPFGVGTKRRQENLISGVFGERRCATFTHHFEHRTSDDSSIEQDFQITLTELDIPLPRLDLVPESFGSRAWQFLGGSDIDLESAAFNRAWRVLCADRRYAVDVLDPRMMERLLQPDALGYAIRIDGGAVLIWQPDPQGTADLARRLGVVTSIAKRLPAHVVRRYTEVEQRRRADEEARLANAPTWAKEGGILNSGRYTGIGVDAEGDGVEDFGQSTS